jgi:signal transduction histidine kinase
MSGTLLLDWATMTVSLFDTLLLLWLGLTVLLNAERRTWGIWLAGGGMLMGGLFFVSHSAILGHGSTQLSRGMEFWWRAGWLPVVGAPLAWYAVVLWYSGFWGDPRARLHRRQRPWFVLAVLLALALLGLLLLAHPLPSFWQVARLDLEAAPSAGGVPLVILVYPAYIVLCVVLPLDALRHPGPTARVMGDLARRRARPWLTAASVALLLVSLLVASIVVWVALSARSQAPGVDYDRMGRAVACFDLVIASLIAVAVLLLGQAVVAYEVFTGRTLPRRGLSRHWRSAVILAAGYGAVVGGSLVLRLRPIYGLLLATILMVVFYALFSWRSYAERDRYIEHLRPFVASQRLYERLLAPSAPSEVDVAVPFRALCEDVLEARLAQLVAVGPLAPLVGPPLVCPAGAASHDFGSLSELVARFDSPQAACVSLDPTRHGGATWAVPLWSERGLIGVLLLGEKRTGGLYTQEEIEIARATGERLIDTRASAELARRLMALQRQRLAESQVLDRRARRVLHDDVLPCLHAAMLLLGSEPASEAVSLLSETHRRISDLLREIPAATAPDVVRWGPVQALRRVVSDELGGAFDAVEWQVEPEAEEEARSIPPLAAEVLFYAAREAIRNAARHGRSEGEDRPFVLRVAVGRAGSPPALGQGGLVVTVEDNGVGMGVAPRAEDSAGQGLPLHSTMMAVLGGTLSVESVPHTYTRVVLALPRRELTSG